MPLLRMRVFLTGLSIQRMANNRPRGFESRQRYQSVRIHRGVWPSPLLCLRRDRRFKSGWVRQLRTWEQKLSVSEGVGASPKTAPPIRYTHVDMAVSQRWWLGLQNQSLWVRLLTRSNFKLCLGLVSLRKQPIVVLNVNSGKLSLQTSTRSIVTTVHTIRKRMRMENGDQSLIDIRIKDGVRRISWQN